MEREFVQFRRILRSLLTRAVAAWGIPAPKSGRGCCERQQWPVQLSGQLRPRTAVIGFGPRTLMPRPHPALTAMAA